MERPRLPRLPDPDNCPPRSKLNMPRPDFSHLPEDLQCEVLRQPLSVQKTLAGLTPDQIERNITVSAEAQAVAAGLQLTPEELVMTSEKFAQHCVRMSQENLRAERQAKRAQQS
jgi:hypothetical protein